MAMNREQRRYLQKQGQIDEEGNPVATRRESRPATRERVGPRTYLSEVMSELHRVSWPSRPEVVRYSIVVLITLLSFTAMVAAFDYGFGELVNQLLESSSSS